MEKLLNNPIVRYLKTNIYWILLETAVAFIVMTPILIAADVL